MVYILVGGLLWTIGVTSLGLTLGKVIPEDKIDHYLLPIILCIIVLSLFPSVWHLNLRIKNLNWINGAFISKK